MKKYIKIFATMATGIALIFGAFASCSNSSDGGTSGGGAGESSTPTATIGISSSWETGKSENGRRSVKLEKHANNTYTYAFWAETSGDLIVEQYKWNLEGNDKTNGPKIVASVINNVTEEKKDTSYIVNVEVAPKSAAIQNSTITLTLTVTCTLNDTNEKITLSDVINIILEETN